LASDRGQVVSGTTNVPARIATELQEDFVNIPREKLEYIGIAPPQLMSIATSLIPFLEHDDANRALMGSNMQRQTVPVIKPTRPIVSTGLEGLVVGESGHALTADKAGIVSYVSGSIIEIDSCMKHSFKPVATFAKTSEYSNAAKTYFPGFSPAIRQDSKRVQFAANSIDTSMGRRYDKKLAERNPHGRSTPSYVMNWKPMNAQTKKQR